MQCLLLSFECSLETFVKCLELKEFEIERVVYGCLNSSWIGSSDSLITSFALLGVMSLLLFFCLCPG